MSSTRTRPRRRLTITPRHLQAVRLHAATAYPEECCGFLVGRNDEEGSVLIERLLPARNEAAEERDCRFLISPETVLAARREARSLGLEVVGYYHSHPDGTAEPSERDREDAWPAMSYLIVAVDGGEAGEARSWRLREDRRGFLEETVMRPGGAGRNRARRRDRR